MERLLPPIFKALAERKKLEHGGKGEVVFKCPGTNCGVAFYRSETEKEAGLGTCCPGCRKLQPVQP
jgi:hypothetical protein